MKPVGYQRWQAWLLDRLPRYCCQLGKEQTGRFHIHGWRNIRRIFYVHSSESCAWDLTYEQFIELVNTCETEMEIMAYLRKQDEEADREVS